MAKKKRRYKSIDREEERRLEREPLMAANFHRQDTCASCAYHHPIEGDIVMQCTAFKKGKDEGPAPFVHQAYICDEYDAEESK